MYASASPASGLVRALRDQFVFRFPHAAREGTSPSRPAFLGLYPDGQQCRQAAVLSEPGDIEKVRPGLEEALAAEIELIVRRIPAGIRRDWVRAHRGTMVYTEDARSCPH